MRKLLLASAAILGATGGLAMAQVAPAPSQGMMMAPYGAGPSPNTNNNAWADPHTVSGSAAAGGLSGYGSQGGSSYTVPAPGTVVIRLGGKVEADISAGSGSLSSYRAAGVVGGIPATTYKVNPINIGSYMRLYPGFDGMSANGIRYGAAIELRENFQNAQGGNYIAGATANAPSSASVNTSAQTVMVRRAFTYLASDKAGLVRLGQGDGLISLFDNCIFSSQCWDAGVGVFQGNIYGGFYPTNASGGGAVNYPWLAQAGAEYGNNKIVYLTPQFYGFDFGIQYAPSQGNAYANTSPNAGISGQPATGTPSDALIGITSGSTTNRWINQWAVGGRYEHTFDSVDVKAYGVYMGAGHESAPITSAALNLMPISLYQGGLAVTTGGLTAAVTYQGGNVNNQLGLLQSGGAKMNATVVGLTYLNGPWTAGVTAGFVESQGAQGILVGQTQRHQFELSVGGNYKLAPGVNLVLEYGYYQTHQGNFNFATGASGGGVAYNDVKTQAIDFTTMLTW